MSSFHIGENDSRQITLEFNKDSYRHSLAHVHSLPITAKMAGNSLLGDMVIDSQFIGQTFIASTDPSAIEVCKRALEDLDRNRGMR